MPADGHRGPVRRLKTLRRPPLHPDGGPGHLPRSCLTPFRCLHAVHPCPSVDSGLGEGPGFLCPSSIDYMSERASVR